MFNPLNAELNPICHLLALLGGATIVVVSRLRVKPPQLFSDSSIPFNLRERVYDDLISPAKIKRT